MYFLEYSREPLRAYLQYLNTVKVHDDVLNPLLGIDSSPSYLGESQSPSLIPCRQYWQVRQPPLHPTPYTLHPTPYTLPPTRPHTSSYLSDIRGPNNKCNWACCGCTWYLFMALQYRPNSLALVTGEVVYGNRIGATIGWTSMIYRVKYISESCGKTLKVSCCTTNDCYRLY